jgi:thiamine-phosphate pyrophosphorylase
MRLPRLYAIVDSGLAPIPVSEFARELVAGGVTLIQYRNKQGSSHQLLSDARGFRRACPSEITLIMNDRADLALAADFDGVHLGQHDLPIRAARRLLQCPKVIGVSTHSVEEVQAAEASDADYIAMGPVFSTASKADHEPTVGLDGIRRARTLTQKPIVAIGGITLENCRSVIAAGADSVAVISSLLSQPRQSSAAFLQVLL